MTKTNITVHEIVPGEKRPNDDQIYVTREDTGGARLVYLGWRFVGQTRLLPLHAECGCVVYRAQLDAATARNPVPPALTPRPGHGVTCQADPLCDHGGYPTMEEAAGALAAFAARQEAARAARAATPTYYSKTLGARVTVPDSAELCVTHPAYEADNCPGCGTSPKA